MKNKSTSQGWLYPNLHGGRLYQTFPWHFFSYQMAFLKLFILLALPYTCVSKRGLRYTNTWAVKIDGDIKTVKNIAQRNGFNYKMKVFFYSPKTSGWYDLHIRAQSVVQRPIGTNPRLNFNLHLCIPLFKYLFGMISLFFFKSIQWSNCRWKDSY